MWGEEREWIGFQENWAKQIEAIKGCMRWAEGKEMAASKPSLPKTSRDIFAKPPQSWWWWCEMARSKHRKWWFKKWWFSAHFWCELVSSVPCQGGDIPSHTITPPCHTQLTFMVFYLYLSGKTHVTTIHVQTEFGQIAFHPFSGHICRPWSDGQMAINGHFDHI